jgi:hypothetical protein
MFPTNDSLKKLLDKIKNAIKANNENDIEIKLADIIKEYFKYKKEEIKRISSKKNQKIPKGNTMNTKDEHKSISSIYIGKEDCAEEKEIIKQLDEKYFTDVMNINKTYDCNRDYNSTCILIQLLKNQTQENKKNENDIKNEENAKKVSEEKEKEKEKEKEIKKEKEIDKISTKNFVCLALLGKGSFGEVYLVQKIDTKNNYAMKILRKERIMGQNLSKYALAERNVLSLCDHPFIVKLNYAFQNSTKLFLILEYCPGGDLAAHLNIEKKFKEDRAKFYLCEVLLALEDLH